MTSMKIALLLAVLAAASAVGCSNNSPGVASPTAAAPAKGDLVAGSTAPEFTATAHDGTSVKLSELKGKYVVLYFYPKDETPGCTKEACAFRDAFNELKKEGVVLVGISSDSVESHKDFAAHHKLPFLLVSDPDGVIAKAYGVGSTFGFMSRQSFVVDKDGKIKKVYRSVNVANHANEILADVHAE
jgi:peroxiredoxin Q/BCP